MTREQIESAAFLRTLVVCGSATTKLFRDALSNVPANDRDVWLDAVLGQGEIPDDGPALPRGCVPYLPCPVDALFRMVELAEIGPFDVFVDIGAGVGRAAAIVHLLTGARAIGLEIQPSLVRAAHELRTRMNLTNLLPIEGDAADLARLPIDGSVFFLYCPFSGDRLERLFDDLENIARKHAILVCSVDLPLPHKPWLERVGPSFPDLTVHRSTISPTTVAV